MATVGAYGPPNLKHLLLDNGVHDSTGGQATVSAGVSFAEIAAACGYTDAGSFRRLFHRATGMSPGEYRKRFTVRAKRPHWRVESALEKE